MKILTQIKAEEVIGLYIKLRRISKTYKKSHMVLEKHIGWYSSYWEDEREIEKLPKHKLNNLYFALLQLTQNN